MKRISIIILFTLSSVCLKSQPFNVTDSLALVDFYYATNGNTWTNDSNWLVTPVRKWKHLGFATNDSTRVRGIVNSGNNLTGYLPLSIGNMSELHVIDLGYNNISGTIPYTIGRLKKVIELDLEENHFSGQLTDSIGQMTALQGVNLYNNNFTGYIPASLASLPDFNGMLIFNNQFDALPDFSGLQWISIADFRLANNLFTFEDLEPNMLIHSFIMDTLSYSPQRDSINMATDTIIYTGTTFVMKCTIGGQHNIYQWSKDTIDITGATDSILTLNNVAFGDSGIYSCRVTNSVVTGLTFYRRPVNVHVIKFNGISTNEQFKQIVIYPNPASNLLYIECSIKNSEILISDILGNVKIEQQTNSNYTLVDISGLEKGVYFIKVVSEIRITTGKFVKE